MRRLAILAVAAALIAPAGATAKHQPPVFRQGSYGPRVAGLQWLLGGHKPATLKHRTFDYKPNGLFGSRTADAVRAWKWWAGYPKKYVRPIAGPYMLELLLGEKQRPAAWVAIAARRLRETTQGATKIAIRIKQIEAAQLDVGEHPPGSNWGTTSNGLQGGATVLAYQTVTHAIGAAWCVSLQQWSFQTAGYGTFANDSASVYYVADYAAARGWLHPQAKVGALVAFVDYDSRGNRIPGTGHMGYVIKVTAHGFVSIEGNADNRVLERFHTIGDRGAVFLWLPGLTTPGFPIFTSLFAPTLPPGIAAWPAVVPSIGTAVTTG